MGKWLELLGRLGRALLDLLSAELGAFADDLRGTRRELIRAVTLLACAGGFALLSLSVFTMAVVWGLAQVMAAWAAALVVAFVYATVAAVVASAARRRLQRLETPVDTLRRRWDDQRDWFQDRVLGAADEPDRGDS